VGNWDSALVSALARCFVYTNLLARPGGELFLFSADRTSSSGLEGSGRDDQGREGREGGGGMGWHVHTCVRVRMYMSFPLWSSVHGMACATCPPGRCM
jgi:hypothetical protein